MGGGFQDCLGNPLAGGTLKLHLSQDCSISGIGLVCSGIDITIQLDSAGNAASSTSTPAAANQYVWSNLVMAPQNNYYRVTGYTAEGQRAFGSNNQQVGSGASFNLDAWVPNSVISWFPPTTIQSLAIEVHGVPALDQELLNFYSSDSTVTITDEGSGNINFQAVSTPPTPLAISIAGTPTADQAVLDFESTDGSVTISNPSGGLINLIAHAGTTFGGGGAFFIGPGIRSLADVLGASWNPVQSNVVNGNLLAAGTLTAYLFQLDVSFTVSKATVQATSGVLGATSNFGIYSHAGGLLLDTGSFSTIAGAPLTNTFTSVTLPPGVYWHIQASSTASPGATFQGLPATNDSGNILPAYVKNATRAAIAANLMVGGTLPATLGTLTPFTPISADGDGPCCPVYE
jgi:hypothetical protein